MAKGTQFIHKIRVPIIKHGKFGNWKTFGLFENLDDAMKSFLKEYTNEEVQHSIFYNNKLILNCRQRIWVQFLKDTLFFATSHKIEAENLRKELNNLRKERVLVN